MMRGAIGYHLVYDDNTFGCPDCHYVHFEKDWRPKWVADEQKFQIECINRDCRHELIVFVKDGLMFVTPIRIEKFINRKKNKIQTMRRITDIQAHVNRYADVNINDKVKLVAALSESIEADRQKLLDQMKANMEKLQNGELPTDEPAQTKRTRKKKDEQPQDQSQEDDTLPSEISSDDL